MASVLLFTAVVGVCLLMLWASHKMEPHWVSKDGERMICFGQGMSRNGVPAGRWRELRVSKVRDGRVEVRPRRGSIAIDRPAPGIGSAAGLIKRRHPKASTWSVVGQTETPLRNRVLYILSGNDDPAMPDMIAIRLPAKSKAIPMLESLAANPTPARSSVTSSSPGTSGSADPPGPG